MASDFWTSTHCNTWLIPQPSLDHLLKTLPDHSLYHLPVQDILSLHIHFSSLIHKLARKISLRQSAISTACVYFKRFYTRNSFAETDPFLVLTACVYVAAKVEETPIHVKSVLTEARSCLSDHSPRPLPTDYTKLAEMEFYLLHELEFDMVVYHPYTTLLNVCGREVLDDGYWSDDDEVDVLDGDVSMDPAQDEDDEADAEEDTDAAFGSNSIIRQMKRRQKRRGRRRTGETEVDWQNRVWGRGSGRGSWQVDDGVFQMAWFIINDSYKTHLSLLYPPYMIALAALYLAFSLEDKSTSDSHRLRGKVLMPYNIGEGEEPGVYYVQKPPGQAGEGALFGVGTDAEGTFEPIKLLTRSTAPSLFASLNISLPMLLSIVQQLVSLYPLWDSFAPRRNPATGVPNSGLGMGSGLGTVNDPKAHLMAYRAAQALRRAQAVDKEKESRELAANAREGTRAHLQAQAQANTSAENEPADTAEKYPVTPSIPLPGANEPGQAAEKGRQKRYPERPVRYPPGPRLTEEGVPALLTMLWRDVANRQEREREARRLG